MQNIMFITLILSTCFVRVIYCSNVQINNQNFIVNKNIMITASVTSIEIRKVKSRIVCAGLCVSNSLCCSVSYDLQTSECLVDYNCFPDSASSQNGTFLRKSPYVPTNYQSLSYVTTTKYELSFETTKRDIARPDSTNYTKRISTTASTYSNNKSGENSNNGTDQNANNENGDNSNNGADETIDVTSLTTTDNGPTGNPVDCSSISSFSPSGVYKINVANQPIDVFCEMTDNGQWTVIQRRLDGTTDFYRNWQEYKNGFGNVNHEYWLGNDNLHQILSTTNYKLRIDLTDWSDVTKYAEYDTFVVGSEDTNYRRNISGYNGDAGDSILNTSNSNKQMNGMQFTTSDKDNDLHPYINCASEARHSSWWINWDTDCNLNGKYHASDGFWNDGMYWNSWYSSKNSLKSVSMKIKPD